MFTTPNPFLQLTLPRVHKAMKRLGPSIWENPRPVKVSFAGSRKETLLIEEAVALTYEEIQLPFYWGRLMQTGWFKLEFPAVLSDKPQWLEWRDQGEGTLVIDGVQVYGFDVAHRIAPLPAGAETALIEGLCLQSGIWHPEASGIDPLGSCLTVARVLERNDAAWNAYMDLEVLVTLTQDEGSRSLDFGGVQDGGIGNKPKIERVSPLLRRLLRVLDDAINAYDAEGLDGLVAALAVGKESLRGAEPLVQAVLTGHAHIDLVWLWNEACGEYKARHTFASMNTLMDQYPEFRFAYSQSASYDAVARTAPALFKKVKQRVEEGKWEAVGATYVESDTIMACGEALARSFLVGQERFRDLFGQSSTLLWLPDVFGYCGCLPQIMRQCGVERFFTTKLTWSNINLFPHSSFRWRGTDGSEVLTHVTQGLGYNLNAHPSEIRKGAKEYRQSDVHDAFLSPTGFGDGGGGVTPEMCERARRLKDLAGVPSTSWGRLADFYDDLETVRDRLPVYQGELYLEYHRGTVTTHGDLKEAFRGLERALQVQEAVYTLCGKGPVDPHAWQRLVFSQFHDYIPGSSIWEVYEEGLPELRKLAVDALQQARENLGAGNHMVNVLPMSRKVATAKGLVTLAPLASVDLDDLQGQALTAMQVQDHTLTVERVHAEFSEFGEVTRLVIDGQELPLSGTLNGFSTYADFPHQFDAWDIDRQTLHLEKPVVSTALRTDWQPEQGAGLAFTRKIGDQSEVEVRYWVDPAQPVLQVELVLDWQEDHLLLKAMFPTGYQGRFARFGSPFNSVLRSQQPGDLKDEAMFESCASRWVTVMDDGQSEGLSLITENKYGVSCRDGRLGLSLVRSVPVTGEDDGHRKIFVPSLREGQPRNPLSDQRVHTIRYALGRYVSTQPREETAAALADILYTPVLKASAPKQAGLLGLSGGESLVPAWCKPLSDGSWILRLHEVFGRSGQIQLTLDEGWCAVKTNLSEVCEERRSETIPFAAYEIVSVKIFRMTFLAD